MPDEGASASDNGVVVAILDRQPRRSQLASYLSIAGFEVCAVCDEAEMEAVLSSRDIDAVILDLGDPDQDRLKYCQYLRSRHSTGVVTIGTSGEVSDKVLALEVGADDYIQAPVNSRELLARLKAVVRGRNALKPAHLSRRRVVYEFAGWRLDVLSRDLINPEGRTIRLGSSEFCLLHALVRASQTLLSRQDLSRMINSSSDPLQMRTVDVLMSRLRSKFPDSERRLFHTVRKEGYCLTAKAQLVPQT